MPDFTPYSQLYSEALAHYPTHFWTDRCEETPRAEPVSAQTPLPHPDQVITFSEDARIAPAPCLAGTLVKRLECIHHASLPEPAAFVLGVHIAPCDPAGPGEGSTRSMVRLFGAEGGSFSSRVGLAP